MGVRRTWAEIGANEPSAKRLNACFAELDALYERQLTEGGTMGETMTEGKLYACKLCPEKFDNKNRYAVHCRMHKGGWPGTQGRPKETPVPSNGQTVPCPCCGTMCRLIPVNHGKP